MSNQLELVQKMINENQLPIMYEFGSVEEFADDSLKVVNDNLFIILMNTLLSKIHNVPLVKKDGTTGLKEGDDLLVLLIKDCEDCFPMNYSEGWIEEKYPLILQTLIEEERYEECQVLQFAFNKYQSMK